MNIARLRGTVFWTALALLLTGTLRAQSVLLNELMAVNTTAHPDIVDFEDYPDWIELKNTTDQAISLDRFALSDDPDEPGKWAFPASAIIPAHGYFIVWADGHDAGPSGIFPRGYWPWRSFRPEGYHTSFSLSAEGESLILSELAQPPIVSLITPGTPAPAPPASATKWRYLTPLTDPGTSWRDSAFDDSSWPEGPAQLGFGDGDEATVIDSPNSLITAYFRTHFQIADPASVKSLDLRLLADDGAIVYLNGQEVVRLNMPAGAVNFQTHAANGVSGSDEETIHSFSVPPERLVAGVNHIAVEIHQIAGSSTDISFDMALEAHWFGEASPIDRIDFPKQVADVSFGRDPQDPAVWREMAKPTPGAANQEPFVDDLRRTSGKVAFSLPPGFYTEPPTVTLSAAAGDIRYTLDGSLPRLDSALYTTPLTISSNTALRARVFEVGKVPGPIETRTYFVNEPLSQVPIMSFSADPETLFGNRIGIYYNQHEPSTTGGRLRDVYKNKEIPSSIEFFEPNGKLGFRVDAGTTIGAENSWAVAQRPLNVHTRSKFGFDTIHYDLFPGSGLGDHTFITFRNGGDNWSSDMLRDAMLPFIADGQLHVGTTMYRPTVVFINGAYWGIHELRQRFDEGWFFAKYHLHVGEYDHLGYAHVDSPALKLEQIEGTTNRWVELLTFLDTKDLNVETNWAHVENEIDLDSLIDWATIESYTMNISWRHNRQFWCATKTGSRWQWLASDIDRAFVLGNLGTSGQLPAIIAEDQIMRRVVSHPDFKARFAQRFAAHLASTFAPPRLIAIVDRLEAELAAEVPRHAARWGPEGGMTVKSRTDSLQGVRAFAQQRPEGALAEYARNLSLSGTHVLTLLKDASNGGKVLVNRVPVPPGPVRLFANLPFELSAEPAPGFKFAGWSGAVESTGTAPITHTLIGDAALTAHFVPSDETVLPNTVETDTVLAAAGSPYTVTGDLVIKPNATLSLDPGVELRMPPGAHIRVQGALNMRGTAELPVTVRGRNNALWGAISFEQPGLTSTLSHASIKQATRGVNPTVYPYAISGLDAHLVLDSLELTESESTVFARRGSTIMRNCRIYAPYTGDGINVKGGYAETTGCTFLGNNSPDTDAIDYDGVINGVIRGNRIYRFVGSNSDAIDCGEECQNLLVEDNRIYFMSDKGISVGQASSVILRHNLIVGCNLGAGIKDHGSILLADQNTFVRNQIGVAVYEKNFGDGGGEAVLVNNIISRSAIAPFTVDSLSDFSATYSLSDTVPVPGTGNLFTDPKFVSPPLLDFELPLDSPARDAGDPAHPLDPDGSRADIGAPYRYAPEDYPYPLHDTVVINELLANSEDAPDWVELHNRTANPIDIGGWFLSDSDAEPRKYRIAQGTSIPAGGYLVFYEDKHFGRASTDPGRLVPFALEDTGDTVHLYSALGDTLTGYEAQESYGAALNGVSLGVYYKPETDSYNFVPLAAPTPGGPNAGPKVGPIVISEIFYAPVEDADEEFLELSNISAGPVSTLDPLRGLPWRITDGIEFSFPTNPPVTFAAGERIVLVRDLGAFQRRFTVPNGTRIFAWPSGKLDNAGELLQLAQPGPLDNLNQPTYARVDRVNYGVALPWPAISGREDQSLNRLDETAYGNTFLNWDLAAPSPGAAPMGGFERWEAAAGLPVDQRGESDDPDRDGLPNLLEYALGSNPANNDSSGILSILSSPGASLIEFPEAAQHAGVTLELEATHDLGHPTWTSVATSAAAGHRRFTASLSDADLRFFRLRAHRK